MRAIEHRYAMATRAAHFPTSEAENLMDAYEEVTENSKQRQHRGSHKAKREIVAKYCRPPECIRGAQIHTRCSTDTTTQIVN